MWIAVFMQLAAELFEAAWQKADTLRGAMENANRYFSKSVFLFLSMHTGYLATLFISLYYDLLNWPIIGILAFKTMDIFFKMDIISRLYGDKEVLPQISAMLDTTIPKWYYLTGAVTYPYFVYIAFEIK